MRLIIQRPVRGLLSRLKDAARTAPCSQPTAGCRGLRRAALLAVFVLGSAQAQNLVPNGAFDSDTSGWQLDGAGQLVWSPMDANGAPGSGAAQLTNTSPSSGFGTGFKRCIPMTSGTAWILSAKAMVPSGVGQSLLNESRPAYRFYSDTNCSTPIGGPIDFGPGNVAQFDLWQNFGPRLAVAPPQAQAIELRGLISKLVASGTPMALFDDYVAVSDTAFLNGFE